MYQVILAGGSGTRFWPYSREDSPKQMLSIVEERSMIRMTYDRLLNLSPAEHILIVASRKLCELIKGELPDLPAENFIVEPSAKNTAPAIALAATHVLHRGGNTVMGIYPSDHLIKNEPEFEKAVRLAEKQATEKPSLLTMGIEPVYPATGYGYIQFLPDKTGVAEDIHKVKTFAEKPEVETAVRFLKSGDFLWNSGMFIWDAKVILNEMRNLMPELHHSMKMIQPSIGNMRYQEVLEREWRRIKGESIDYGILEKSNNVYTIKAKFTWSDVGSWKSLFDVLEKDEFNNAIKGLAHTINTKNSLIFSPDNFTAVIGMKNVVVINMGDATLVMPMEKAEMVKELVGLLKSTKAEKYL